MAKTIVDAETEIGIKKTRAARTPKSVDYAQLEKQALLLSLQERASLCKKLKQSIQDELVNLQSVTKEAEQIANGI
jgi:hypothetical protein